MDETPTLAEVARTIYWEEGLEISEAAISAGLQSAGFRADDPNERRRLRSLIVAQNRIRTQDTLFADMADVDEFLDDARQLLGPKETDIRLIVQLAQELKEEAEADLLP